MPFKTTLTPDDMKSGELVDRAGWFPIEVTDYSEKDASDEAKNPGSTNCIWEFTIIDGPNKGLTVTKLINEHPKSLGHKSNRSLWESFGFPKNSQGTYDLSTQLFEQTVGFKLMGYISRGKTNRGNEFNEVKDFKKMS